jgi:multidrug efflux pump subunit AcrA (membrane-fusion protein)
MKIIKKYILVPAVLIIVIAALLFFTLINNKNDNKVIQSFSGKVQVSDNGNKIVIPKENEGIERIKSEVITRGNEVVQVLAPSRVVATISSASGSNDKIVLFDSPDLTSLYSQYKQSKINYDLTQKNLARVKEMFESNSATGKDMFQAESDLANARASYSEMEGRFKAYGFNASEIENSSPGSIWLISDVTETQLRDVDKGESVDIYYNAYPEKKFTGKAVAIGDIVDPLTRTIKVRVIMRNPKFNIYPGMFARIDYGDPREKVLSVPNTSVITVEGNDYVFVQHDDTLFERRRVMIGEPSGSRLIILSGLKDNEKIVSEGTILLKGLSFNY